MTALALLAGPMLAPMPANAQGGKPVILPKNITDPQEKCRYKIVVKMGEGYYALERRLDMTYTTMEGKKINSEDIRHPSKNCTKASAGKVSAFSTGLLGKMSLNLTVALPAGDFADKALPTTYAQHKELIDKTLIAYKAEKLPDGTRKIASGNVNIFILLPKAAPTANGEPVAIYCRPRATELGGRQCTTRYRHPDGITLSYDYLEGPQVEPFIMDILARKKLAELKYTPKRKAAATPGPQAQPSPQAK